MARPVMITIGLILIYLDIAKNYEPTLLLPMGFGAILVNIPLSSAITQIDPANGRSGRGCSQCFLPGRDRNGDISLLIFYRYRGHDRFLTAVQNPSLLLFGAAAQFGIFMTMVLASFLWL